MKYAIFSKKDTVLVKEAVQEILGIIPKSDVVIHSDYHNFAEENGLENWSTTYDLQNLNIDILISIGGDGTMLESCQYVYNTDIKLVGINLGRLGFLASIEFKEMIGAMKEIMAGSYKVEYRKMLSIESNLPLFEDDQRRALNDFTILKRDNSSMITIHAYINGDYLNSYWGDGLIVATPTGSTAYSLSCGGPILYPTSSNFVITPVAPHNLNVRPVVIPDDSVITFSVEGRAKNFLCTLDSRYELITKEHEIAVKCAPHRIALIRLTGNSFARTIQAKLHWGLDKRNV